MIQIAFSPKFEVGQTVFVVDVRYVSGNDGHVCSVCQRSHYPEVPFARVDRARVVSVDFHAQAMVGNIELTRYIVYQLSLLDEPKGVSAREDRVFNTLEEAQKVAREAEQRR